MASREACCFTCIENQSQGDVCPFGAQIVSASLLLGPFSHVSCLDPLYDVPSLGLADSLDQLLVLGALTDSCYDVFVCACHSPHPLVVIALRELAVSDLCRAFAGCGFRLASCSIPLMMLRFVDEVYKSE